MMISGMILIGTNSYFSSVNTGMNAICGERGIPGELIPGFLRLYKEGGKRRRRRRVQNAIQTTIPL